MRNEVNEILKILIKIENYFDEQKLKKKKIRFSEKCCV